MSLTQISEKFASVTSTLQSTLEKSTSIVSDKLNLSDNYNHISNKFADNYKQITQYYPSITESLSNTRSVINNGTGYIRSIPASVGDKVYSYASILEAVDGSEEEIPRSHPNKSLAEDVIPLNDERVELVNLILDLQSYKVTKESFKYYDDEVVYEDQLIHTSGLQNVKAQFYYGSTKLLKSTTVSYKILENTKLTLKIGLSQKYFLPLVGRAFVLNNNIIALEFDEEGKKITKHTDLFGGFYPFSHGQIFRKGAAKIYNTFVKVPSEL